MGGGVILGGGSKESVGQRSRDHPLQVSPHKTTMGVPRCALPPANTAQKANSM